MDKLQVKTNVNRYKISPTNQEIELKKEITKKIDKNNTKEEKLSDECHDNDDSI
jgi:hypothetical protein